MRSSLLLCLCLAALAGAALGQNYNAPFPRIGVVTFDNANIGEEIWRNHELIVIRSHLKELAKKLKQQNPGVVVLAATDDIVGNNGLAGDLPASWHVTKADGKRIFAGEGWWMNLTKLCPRQSFDYRGHIYQNLNCSEFFAEYFLRNVDWRYFDGVFFDSWATSIRHIGPEQYNAIDFDRDGTPDNSQRKDLADEYWQEGNRLLIAEFNKRLPNKPIAAHEAGPEEATFLHGLGMEGWKGGGWEWVFSSLLGVYRSSNGPQPRINFVEAGATKDNLLRMRYGITTACLTGSYFGMDEGLWAHRYTYLYDEYLVPLGQPLGEPEQLSALGQVWLRYFDKGAVICNGSGAPQTVTAADLQGGPYYKFLGGQAPEVNDGKPFNTITLHGVGGQIADKQEGDGIILVREPMVILTDIVIDNVDINMTSPGNDPVSYQGAWTQQPMGDVPNTVAYSLSYGWDEYGTPYAYSNSGNGENTATYTPKINVAGRYEVFEWHGWHGNTPESRQEASNVPYLISHREGTASGTIDQTQNYGKWNSLGTFNFNTGTNGKVVLSNKANGIVISDAIKFVCKENTVSPDQPDRTPPAPPTGVKIAPEQ